MRVAWKPLLAVALAAVPVVAAVGTTYAAFSSTTSATGSFAAQRIYSGERSSAAWQLEDAANGTPADGSSPHGFTDGIVYRTGNWSNAWSGTRYVELELQSPLAAGLATSGVSFVFRFADNDGAGGNQWCFYFETRRTSTAALLGVHGSTASPVGCEAAGTQTTFTTSLPEVTTSDLANDLTVRVYGMHSGGGKAVNIDRAVVTGTALSAYTLYASHLVDAATGSPSTQYWGPAKINDQAFQNTGNWSSSYAAGRYLKFTFPAFVPGSATVTAATFEYTYKSQASGSTACYYFEVYAGATLIATHGSSSSDVDCNATTSYETVATALPAVDTAEEARTLSIKLFAKVSGSKPTLTDGAILKVTYSLNSGVSCLDPGTETLTATADAHVEEANPNTNYAASIDLKVKTKPSQDRRAYVTFSLPTVPANCSVTTATLRLYGNGVQGTRTIEAYRAAAAWSESTLTWSNQPGPTGTAATTPNALGWREWAVTAQVQAQYASGNYGFVLKDSVEDDAADREQKYDSRENVEKPQLVVTFG